VKIQLSEEDWQGRQPPAVACGMQPPKWMESRLHARIHICLANIMMGSKHAHAHAAHAQPYVNPAGDGRSRTSQKVCVLSA